MLHHSSILVNWARWCKLGTYYIFHPISTLCFAGCHSGSAAQLRYWENVYQVFGDIKDTHAIAADLLISTEDEKFHDAVLLQLIECMRENNMKFNTKKIQLKKVALSTLVSALAEMAWGLIRVILIHLTLRLSKAFLECWSFSRHSFTIIPQSLVLSAGSLRQEHHGTGVQPRRQEWSRLILYSPVNPYWGYLIQRCRCILNRCGRLLAPAGRACGLHIMWSE